MADQVKNGAYSTTTAAVTAGATSFSVQSGHGARFSASASGAYNLCVWNPNYPTFAVALQNSQAEIVRVTTRATDTFSVITRAQESTSAIAWGIGWRVEQNLTAKIITDITTSVAAVVVKCKQFVYTGSIGSNSTVYTIPGLGTNVATESNCLVYSANAYTISNLRLSVIGNVGASVTATIRKNSGDTSVVATAAGSGTGADITNSASYEGVGGTDDVFSIKLVSTASGFTVTATITFDLTYA